MHGVAHDEHRRPRDATEIGANTQNTTLSSGTYGPPCPPGRCPSGGRRLEQALLGPDRVLARGERHLVVARERERARRAGLDAEAAHDAAQVVDLVVLRVPLPGADRVLGVVVLALDPDRVGRARVRAELAPDALLQAVVVAVQQVPADVRALAAAARSPSGTARCCRGGTSVEDRAHALGHRPHRRARTASDLGGSSGRRSAPSSSLRAALVAHAATSSRRGSSRGLISDPISQTATIEPIPITSRG